MIVAFALGSVEAMEPDSNTVYTEISKNFDDLTCLVLLAALLRPSNAFRETFAVAGATTLAILTLASRVFRLITADYPVGPRIRSCRQKTG